MAWRQIEATVLENPYIPRVPFPKQALFLALPLLELFYGGAAGGGKSFALLMAALQFVESPGYAALLLRRTLPDLRKPGALIDISQQWLRATDARWDSRDHRWIFPSGASLNFGYLESESDKWQYQGGAYQFIGFDELTQFTESQYLYLFSRLRRTVDQNVPLRMRSGSNPGNVGHEWVKRRFIREADGMTRDFIPAVLEDNPGMDREAYERSLDQLDPVTRAQMRHGDWDIAPAGNLFKRPWWRIAEARPAKALARCRFWDLAATEGGGDWMVGALMSRTQEAPEYHLEDIVRDQLGPYELEKVVKATAAMDGRAVRIRIEQEPAASGKIVAATWTRLLAGYDVEFLPATGDKVSRWKPYSAQVAAGNVELISGLWNGAYIAEMERVPAKGQPDDQADSSSGAFNDLALGFFRRPGDVGFS